jgi:hypothetical protein
MQMPGSWRIDFAGAFLSEMLDRSLTALETASDMFRLAEAERDLKRVEKDIRMTKERRAQLSANQPKSDLQSRQPFAAP